MLLAQRSRCLRWLRPQAHTDLQACPGALRCPGRAKPMPPRAAREDGMQHDTACACRTCRCPCILPLPTAWHAHPYTGSCRCCITPHAGDRGRSARWTAARLASACQEGGSSGGSDSRQGRRQRQQAGAAAAAKRPRALCPMAAAGSSSDELESGTKQRHSQRKRPVWMQLTAIVKCATATAPRRDQMSGRRAAGG